MEIRHVQFVCIWQQEQPEGDTGMQSLCHMLMIAELLVKPAVHIEHVLSPSWLSVPVELANFQILNEVHHAHFKVCLDHSV